MHLRAYGLLILTAFLWAGNSIAGKIGVGHIDPILLATLRWSIAAVIVVALSWNRLGADWRVIRRHWPLLFGYGATGFCLFNILLYSALTTTSVVNAMIEQAATPLCIFFGNFLISRTRATWSQLAGFALTLAGVVITATHGEPGRLLKLQLNLGDGLMLMGVLVYAGYTVALKWKPVMHWQSFLAVPSIAAALTCLPFLAWHAAHHPVALPDATGWGAALYAGIFAALVASATYVAGIDLIGANRAGLFINLLPVFGVLLSVALLHEPLHVFHFAALGLVCAGIVLSEWGRAKTYPSPN